MQIGFSLYRNRKSPIFFVEKKETKQLVDHLRPSPTTSPTATTITMQERNKRKKKEEKHKEKERENHEVFMD